MCVDIYYTSTILYLGKIERCIFLRLINFTEENAERIIPQKCHGMFCFSEGTDLLVTIKSCLRVGREIWLDSREDNGLR